MKESELIETIEAMGFMDQNYRGRDGDARFQHCAHGTGELTERGFIYVMDDRLTAFGAYETLFRRIAPPPNRMCNQNVYPAWSGDALERLLAWMRTYFSPCA